jgi:hypothetical protein
MSTIPPQLAPKDVPSAPVTPATTDATPLAELNSLFSPHNIKRILRAPQSMQSRTQLDKIRRLLTEDNIRWMLHGQNAEANTKTLEALGKQLNPDTISASLDSARHDAQETLINELQLKQLENVLKSFDGDEIEDLVGAFQKSTEDVETLGKNCSAMGSTAKSFSEFGDLLSRHKLDSLRAARAHVERQQGPETYSANTKVHY